MLGLWISRWLLGGEGSSARSRCVLVTQPRHLLRVPLADLHAGIRPGPRTNWLADTWLDQMRNPPRDNSVHGPDRCTQLPMSGSRCTGRVNPPRDLDFGFAGRPAVRQHVAWARWRRPLTESRIRLHPKARARRGFDVSRADWMIVFASELRVHSGAAPSVAGDDGRAFRVGAVSVTPLQ